MSIEWGENVPTAKFQKRLAEPDPRKVSHAVASRRYRARRMPGSDLALAERVRRNPVSSLLLAAGLAMFVLRVLPGRLFRSTYGGRQRRSRMQFAT